MTKERKNIILVATIVIVAIFLGISNTIRARQDAKKMALIAEQAKARLDAKTKMYMRAPEIDGYPLKDILGKKVILVNFWTSVSSNSLKVIPHLNAWYNKYKDAGLEVIGVHTPEFDFEKDTERLASTTESLSISYPIIQDNDRKTWTNFKNNNWPIVYLIDMDGFIVYSHIGEGGYDTIEEKIQNALSKIGEKLEASNSEVVEFPGTPSYYFGSERNEFLGNGKPFLAGTVTLKMPKEIALNKIYLSGKWNIQGQYAENLDAKAKITFNYVAKEVYLVGDSEQSNQLPLIQDGKKYMGTTTPLLSSYTGQATTTITGENLYLLIQNPDATEHTLEITIPKPGLRIYVVEFR